MKYYVVSDVHGFFNELMDALRDNGWFEDAGEKKLILCGDMMDRGEQPCEMEDFMCDLLDKDELIFVRGNHEDLMLEFIDDAANMDTTTLFKNYHFSNGTYDTALRLTSNEWRAVDVLNGFYRIDKDLKKTRFVNKLIPASVNYYETPNYIFVHGWLPTKQGGLDPDWRNASGEAWGDARWENGMKHALFGNIVKGKTVVCGHWHASWGRAWKDNRAYEWGPFADFSPFYDDGIIAIDGCTAYTHKVNCIVLED